MRKQGVGAWVSLRRDKAQGGGIHAIAQAGGLRAICEDVAQVRITELSLIHI